MNTHHVPGLRGDGARYQVSLGGKLDGRPLVTQVGAEEDQRYGDAEPHEEEHDEGGERHRAWRGRGGNEVGGRAVGGWAGGGWAVGGWAVGGRWAVGGGRWAVGGDNGS